MPSIDKPQSPDRLAQRCDTPEKREGRLHSLTCKEHGYGLTRADAELIDDNVAEILDEVFELYMQRADQFTKRHARLDNQHSMHLAEGFAANAVASQRQLVEHLAGLHFLHAGDGIMIVGLDDPSELHGLLRRLFGE